MAVEEKRSQGHTLYMQILVQDLPLAQHVGGGGEPDGLPVRNGHPQSSAGDGYRHVLSADLPQQGQGKGRGGIRPRRR